MAKSQNTGQEIAQKEMREALILEAELLENIKKTASRYEKIFSQDAQELEILEKIIPNFKPQEASDLVSGTLISMRNFILDLNKLSAKVAPVFQNSDEDEVEFDKEKITAEAYCAACYLTDDAIFIRMPMLWNRQINKRIGKPKQSFYDKANTLFSNSVSYAIEHSDGFNNFDFDRFALKRFQFLFCYSQNDAKRSSIPDNDNHDFKAIQDAVSMYLKGGDSAFSSETTLASASTDDVRSGTYLTVSRLQDAPIASDKIIEFWRSRNESKQ